MGLDGHTVMLRFRDGLNSAVLPASRATPARLPMFSSRRVVRDGTATGGPRALVLEPFATELNLGPNAGVVEADDLQAAGFRVDRLVDGQVTMGTMATLANYNIVYMLTHSGVNQWGEGVVATGELANTDPTIDPMIKEFSVLVVGVVGSSQLYYGIMSRFIQYHVGEFPAHSLMFINGCSMLGASLFWKALASKGMGAMVSWDHDALATDDVPASADFFAAMYGGKDVADAVAAVRADGHGVSRPSGGPVANFGFLGDGTITLQAAAGPTPTPTLVPPTATPVPTRRLIVRLRSRVVPGRRQLISISAPSRASLRIAVAYPNGNHRSVLLTVPPAGALTYTYRQPSNVITPSDVAARVLVSDPRIHASAAATYTIAKGAFDLHIAPSAALPGHRVTFWVYSARSGRGRIDVRSHARLLHRFALRLTPRHWIHVEYALPPHASRGRLAVWASGFGIGTADQPLFVR